MSSIFISHRNVTHDNVWAERILTWIKDQKNIDGFLDFDIQHGLQTGGRWEDDIYAAMNRAQVVIALISPDYLDSKWCTSEAHMAKLQGLKFIPIVITECSHPFGEIQSISISKGEERAFEQLRHALRTTHKLPKRPYPGLAAFQEDDAAVFFGREDETRDLINQVNSLFQGRPEKPRLLLVLGASGSGKSSLLRAGLIPELKSQPKQIAIEPIIPRGAPLDEIAHVLDISLSGLDAEDAADAILTSLKAIKPDYQHALISIDQAEELLRGDQSFFFEVLRTLLDRANGRVAVLATMRSDFLNEFQQSSLIGKGSNLEYETFTLDPLPEDRLNDIIAKPADRFDTAFEDGLVTRIAKDHGGLDALPLLAFFLDEFWRKEYIADGVLQLAEYEKFGGMNQALQKAVDRGIAECVRLDPAYSDRQRLLRDLQEVFLGVMVSVSSISGEAVRNRVAADALTEQQTTLLTAFAKQRLIIEKDGSWEVVHEALFRQWAALRDWIGAAREDLIIVDRIQTAATHWHEAERQQSDLTHTGNRLSEAMSMLSSTRYANRFSAVDEEYLDACAKRYHDQLAKEANLREQAEQESVRARKGEIRARRYTRLAAMVALIATCMSGVAYWQWKLAGEEAVEAEAQLIHSKVAQARFRAGKAREYLDVLEVDVAIALASSTFKEIDRSKWREVARFSPSVGTIADAESRSWRSTILRGHEGPVASAAFAPDGKRIVTFSYNKSAPARIWDVASGLEIATLRGHEGDVYDATFSPDGARVVTASSDNTARIWDGLSGNEVGVLRGHEGPVASAAFSPDGMRIVTASWDKTARIWDVTNAMEIDVLRGHEGAVGSAVFSPDGTRIVTASNDHTARIWDGLSGNEVGVLRGHEGPVASAAFSPNGTHIVTASMDKTARIWDAASSAQITVLSGHEKSIKSAVFSPDGMRIVTASGDVTSRRDGNARLWNATNGAEIAVLNRHEGEVYSAAFSPDGAWVLTSGNDKTARLWDAASGSEIAVLRGHEKTVYSAAFSPDGTRIVTASSDNTARIWGAASATGITVHSGLEQSIRSAAFSPDGTRIVFTSGGIARIWDVANEVEIAVLRGHKKTVRSAVFSPDGTRVVTTSLDQTTRLWDAVNGTEITVVRGHEKEVKSGFVRPRTSAVFSPDGMRFVTTSWDNNARLWDAASGTEIAVLSGHSRLSFVTTVAFSPDGTRIVTGSNDSSARLWDATSGAEIAVLREHEDEVNSAVYSFDGTHIVTASDDGTARLWDASTGAEIFVFRGHENAIVSAVFSSDGKRIVTASWDRTARIWDVASRAVIAVLRGHEREVYTAAFSLDGNRVITASGDKSARLWDVAIRAEIAILRGHEDGVYFAAFSSDGEHIVTASRDMVRIWNGRQTFEDLIDWGIEYTAQNDPMTDIEKCETYLVVEGC